MKNIKPNIKYIYFFIAIFIFISILLFMNTAYNIDNIDISNEPFFLKCKANIYAYEEDTSILSLIFVDSKTNSSLVKLIENSSKIAFDNEEYLEIVDNNVIKGDEYESISLYTLDLKVKFKKTGSISHSKLYFINNQNEIINKFDLGEYNFLIIKESETEERLKLLSHSSIRPTLDKYFLALENISNERIKIKTIELGNFSSFANGIFIQINEEKFKKYNYSEDIILSPKDTINIEISFNESIYSDYDLFVFNPNIKYQYNGIVHNKISMRSFYGVSFNKERMKKLLSDFNKNKSEL